MQRYRDNGLRDTLPHEPNVESSMDASLIWQEETDDEEWTAWMDASTSDQESWHQEDGMWTPLVESAGCALSEDLDQAMGPGVTKSAYDELVDAKTSIGEERARVGDILNTMPAEITQRFKFHPRGEAFTVDEAEVYCNPWYNEQDLEDAACDSLEAGSSRIRLRKDTQRTATPLARLPRESIDETMEFNSWNDGVPAIDRTPSLSTHVPDDEVKTLDSNLDHQSLTRDETQRRLIIQHCMRSQKPIPDDAVQMILATYRKVGLLAWIHRLLDRMKSRAKTD